MPPRGLLHEGEGEIKERPDTDDLERELKAGSGVLFPRVSSDISWA